MARSDHLPVYKKAFEFLVEVETSVGKIIKSNRYRIGEDLRILARQMVMEIVRINNIETFDRQMFFEKILFITSEILLILRVMNRLKIFPNLDTYSSMLESISNIEKQLEGWKKSSLKK